MALPLIPIVGVGLAAAWLLKKALNEPEVPSTSTQRSLSPMLEQAGLANNFQKLKSELAFYGSLSRPSPLLGFVGGPGRGKSSLVKYLARDYGVLSVQPKIGAKTDATDWSVPQTDSLVGIWKPLTGGVVRYVDFPGYGTTSHPTNPHYLKFFRDNFYRFQRILFVVDGKLEESDEEIFSLIRRQPQSEHRIIVVRTKTDEFMNDDDQTNAEADIRAKLRWSQGPIVFVSNKEGTGLDELRSMILQH